MIYSIATVCLSGTLQEKIEAISKAGFRGIEIFENDLITHNGSLDEIRLMLDDNGLEVVTYQPLRDFEGMPDPYRKKHLTGLNVSLTSWRSWVRIFLWYAVMCPRIHLGSATCC